MQLIHELRHFSKALFVLYLRAIQVLLIVDLRPRLFSDRPVKLLYLSFKGLKRPVVILNPLYLIFDIPHINSDLFVHLFLRLL